MDSYPIGMNTKLIFIAGVLVVALGSFLFLSVDDPSPQTKSVSQSKSVLAADQLQMLRERIDLLERKVERLQSTKSRPARVISPSASAAERERRPIMPVTPKPESGAEPAMENLAAAIGREGSPIRREVAQIVQDQFSNMRGEWREMRRARHEARDEERVERFAETAGLDEEQATQMTTLLAQEREQVTAVRRAARDDYDFRGAREKVREVRQATDQALGEVFDERQLELWREDRSQRRGRRR